MKKILPFLVLCTCTLSLTAQKEWQQRPKLVVGIVVDQMRWDYLIRYNDRYCEGGFKRMMTEGYNCNRLLINYIPTVTAVGHAAVYTGTVPAFNGIIANEMYFDGKWATPVRDENQQGMGTQRTEGKASPHRLLCTTMTDELRLATNFRSKVISIGIKDRAAILPGGHCANAAYWMDSETMDWITSTYYMKELPQWLIAFNDKKLGQAYQNKLTRNKKDKQHFWDLMYKAETYKQSAGLDEPYYDSQTGTAIKYSPYGNTYTTDMAIAAIEGERLGNNPTGMTDFLAISFSSTDMIGHQVGPNAPWIEDTYLRLDRDLTQLFDTLDHQVGKGEWVAFLCADHAGSHNVQFRREHGIPAETWPYYQVLRMLNETLTKEFALTTDDPKMKLKINTTQYEAVQVIHSLECQYVYFNDTVIAKVCKNGNPKALKEKLKARTIELLQERDNVAYA
ncbi:MAG: alkaline phosphatase family protein, partial [Bacteroidaceae bacterium]|nr:alkaline phosphatase family protein [Bacteroidaceae bacterium]